MLQLFSKKKNQKGFTLIELLVVIAIIGILSSIAVVNFNSARNKGKDTSIKGTMSSLRPAAEGDYDTNGNYSATCTESGGGAGDSTLTQTAGTEYKRLNDAMDTQKGGTNNAKCNETTNSTAYAVWIELISDTTKAWCIDSLGTSKQVTKPTTEITACP